MANYLHRTTKQYLPSIPPNELAEPIANYISMPDLSAVSGQPIKYWTISGDIISLMSQAERNAVDTTLDVAILDTIANELDQTRTIMRAFAEVVLDEVNLLRGQHSLVPRTLAQLKTAVRAKL